MQYKHNSSTTSSAPLSATLSATLSVTSNARSCVSLGRLLSASSGTALTYSHSVPAQKDRPSTFYSVLSAP